MKSESIFGFYRGNLKITGDVISPLYTDEELEQFERKAIAELEAKPQGSRRTDEDHGSS